MLIFTLFLGTTGYFRTLLTEVEVETPDPTTEIRGYHKPIMIAGGVGTVRPSHALKDENLVQPGAHLIGKKTTVHMLFQLLTA